MSEEPAERHNNRDECEAEADGPLRLEGDEEGGSREEREGGHQKTRLRVDRMMTGNERQKMRLESGLSSGKEIWSQSGGGWMRLTDLVILEKIII